VSAVLSDVLPILRPMQAADLEAVLVVEQAAYEFPWTKTIFRDSLRVGYYCSVIESTDGIIGHGIMSMGVGECHLLNICIHPDYQRMGLGSRLISYLLELAHWKNTKVAYLEVRESNRIACGLYQRLGFEVIGVRKHYYPARLGKRENALILALDFIKSGDDWRNRL